MSLLDDLPKRERAIMEILYARGECSAREVQEALGDGTSNSAIRAFLATLESRGCVAHRADGQHYLWYPLAEPEDEGRSALGKAVRTFFRGSREKAIASLLGAEQGPLDKDEYERLLAIIEKARKRRS